MYTLGIDIGSTTSKVVILEDGKNIKGKAIVKFGTGTSGPDKALAEAFEMAGLNMEDMDKVVATGYGRMNFKEADSQVSELSCHARGVSFLVPDAKTVIDIGGQDAKAMRLNEKGKLENFMMNDKCAAGTGRFLDVMANIIEKDISDLGDLSEKAKTEVHISSTCTVFAESEVISHLSNNVEIPDLVSGIHTSVVKRVATLAKRVGIAEKVVMVGGVAKNKGIVSAMSKELGVDIVVPEIPQLNGALGAAIYAYDLVEVN